MYPILYLVCIITYLDMCMGKFSNSTCNLLTNVSRKPTNNFLIIKAEACASAKYG